MSRLRMIGGADRQGSADQRRLSAQRDTVDIRRFCMQTETQITPSDRIVHVIAPTAGRLVVETSGQVFEVHAGVALLLARREKAQCVWLPGSTAMIVHFRRSLIQARAAETLRRPCRLGGVTVRLPCEERDPLGATLANLRWRMAAFANDPTDVDRLDPSLISALVDALRNAANPAEVFPTVGSVKRAIDFVRANPEQDHNAEELSLIAGVTAATLRRNFKSCLGLPISGFVQQTRLDWIHDRLRTPTETRSIGQLAATAGFGSSSVLARAYQRRFSESPSKTRARAFSPLNA